MTILVDSDILIEIARGRNQDVISRWLQLSQSDTVVMVSPFTVAELWAGAKPPEQNLLRALFQSLLCAPIDEDTGRQAGEYLQKFRGTHSVELGDALIAASAVQNKAELWTRNRKHFPMPGLRFY